jgi:hypothetical protein
MGLKEINGLKADILFKLPRLGRLVLEQIRTFITVFIIGVSYVYLGEYHQLKNRTAKWHLEKNDFKG